MAIKIKGVTVIDDDRKGYFDTISVGSQTTGGTTIEVESTSPAFKIIQKGTGNAFVVEDELNDTTPFVIDAAGNVQISGNLVVNGTTATVNTTSTSLTDPILLLGGENAPTVNDGKDRGVLYRWHDGTTAKLGFFGFDRSGGNLVFWSDASNTNEVIGGTQGTIEALTFKSTVTTGAAPLTVASSTKVDNLNADLVDGIHFTTPTQWGVTYANSSTNLASTVAGSAGQLLRSTGTGAPNWTTATYPNTATASGTILRADGTNWVASSATYPNTAGTNGTVLRATSGGFVNSASTYPDTIAANQLLYASAANTISGLSTSASSIFVTDISGVPSFSTLLPAHSVSTSITVPTVFGSTGASGSLQLTSTSNTTKGTVTIGASGDTVRLGNSTSFGAIVTNDNSGRVTVTTGTAKQFLVAGGASASPSFVTRSPAITLGTDLSGSVTLTDCDGSFTLNATVLADLRTKRSYVDVTQTSAGQSTLLTFAVSQYEAGELLVKIVQGANFEVVKMLFVTNGTDVYTEEYGRIGSPTNVILSANLASGSVTISATSTTTLAKIKGTYTLIESIA